MLPSRRNAAVATAAGALAFGVYVRTLAPGLILIVDTPMFQFIGRVLGIAHNPGYPLYVLLTHPFSYLPVGSLAYRANLFSAVLGAVTVSLTFLIARRLGAGTLASFAFALSLAFGRVFWSQAVIAEVYTLNAALVAGMLGALLTWADTQKPVWFFAAAALFALGLGNHTTIAAFAPGMVMFALAKNRRFSLKPSTIGICLALLGAGLLQYGLLLLRSKPGVYAESPAHTLADVVNIVSGRQFRDWLFVYDVRTVIFTRVPALFESVLVRELTAAGLVLAALGTGYLVWRRTAEAALLLTGGLVMFGFCVNYSAPDIQVFMIPVFVVLSPIAAVGLQQLSNAARTRGAAVGTATVAAALLLPVWQLRANRVDNDLSRRTEAMVYFDHLFEQLPDRTLFVREDFLVDRAISYKLAGEKAAQGRQIALFTDNRQRILDALAAGYHVFAFPTWADRLRFDGLDVAYRAISVAGPRIDELLRDQANGTTVAIAVPALHTAGFVSNGGGSLETIGVGVNAMRVLTQSNAAVIGVRGARRDALVRLGSADASADSPSGQIDGYRAADDVHVRAAATEAVISRGGRDLVRTTDGVAIAIWRPDGILDSAFVLQPGNGFRLTITPPGLALHAVRGELRAQPIKAEWTDITPSTATGWFELRVSPLARIDVEISADARLSPRVIDQSSKQLHAIVAADSSGNYTATVVSTNPTAGEVVQIALGGIARRALARLVGGSQSTPATSSEAVKIPNDGVMWPADHTTEVIRMHRDEQVGLLGAGWSAVDYDDVGTFRWMTDAEARLIIPTDLHAGATIRVQALREHAAPDAPATLTLAVNGRALGVQPLRDGWNTYEWTLPPGTGPGVAVAALVVDRLPPNAGRGARGLAVADLTVLHGASR